MESGVEYFHEALLPAEEASAFIRPWESGQMSHANYWFDFNLISGPMDSQLDAAPRQCDTVARRFRSRVQ